MLNHYFWVANISMLTSLKALSQWATKGHMLTLLAQPLQWKVCPEKKGCKGYIYSLLQTVITADELYGDIWCFFGCFSVLNQVSSYFSCLAECCNSVLLWSSRNVLWTAKHNKTTFITSRIHIFLCIFQLLVRYFHFHIVCLNLKWKCHNLALNHFNEPETKKTQRSRIIAMSRKAVFENSFYYGKLITGSPKKYLMNLDCVLNSMEVNFSY